MSALTEAAARPEDLLPFLVRKHGNVLANGGHFAAYAQALRACRIAARVLGRSEDDVKDEAIAAYRARRGSR